MGSVYRARQLSIGRDVALKVIGERASGHKDTARRFLREARLASQVVHPHTVTVFDFGQTADGLLYLVMELVKGRTLEQVLVDEGPLDPTRIARLAVQICEALEVAHRAGIIHRDLKPGNTILLEDIPGRDHVKVLDFGLAKSLSAGDQSNITATGLLCGTPRYISPEAACGQPVDGRTDLYSLGVMLYELASGHGPFEASTNDEMLIAHATQPPEPLRSIPHVLWNAIERLLAKSPDDRYPSAADCREALMAVSERLATNPAAPLPVLPQPIRGSSEEIGDLETIAGSEADLGEVGRLVSDVDLTTDVVAQDLDWAPADSEPSRPAGARRDGELTDELAQLTFGRRMRLLAAAAILLLVAGAVLAWQQGWLQKSEAPAPATDTLAEGPPAEHSQMDLPPESPMTPPPTGSTEATEPMEAPTPAVPAPESVVEEFVLRAPSPVEPRRPKRAVEAHPETVRLDLKTRPPARVSIGGAAAGKTPLTRELPWAEDTVVVVFSLTGHRSVRKTLSLTRSHRLDIKLPKTRKGKPETPSYIIPGQ